MTGHIQLAPNCISRCAAQKNATDGFSGRADIAVRMRNNRIPLLPCHIVPCVKPPPKSEPEKKPIFERDDRIPDPMRQCARHTFEIQQPIDIRSTDLSVTDGGSTEVWLCRNGLHIQQEIIEAM